MSKQGEKHYLDGWDEEGIEFELNKPFSVAFCGDYLMEIGAVFSLLPSRPAKILDLGCGPGWTSRFFAKRGYEVVGVDISPEAIRLACQNKDRENVRNLQFIVCDYEEMGFDGEFDCVVFFDSLHHCVDEQAALHMAWKALKPGGTCITSEPGRGHSKTPESVRVVKKFDVNERDMPPGRIISAGKKAGFRKFKVYPHASHLCSAIYGDVGKRFMKSRPEETFLKGCLNSSLLRGLAVLLLMHAFRAINGIVVLTR